MYSPQVSGQFPYAGAQHTAMLSAQQQQQQQQRLSPVASQSAMLRPLPAQYPAANLSQTSVQQGAGLRVPPAPTQVGHQSQYITSDNGPSNQQMRPVTSQSALTVSSTQHEALQTALQAERARRETAEKKVEELQAIVDNLRQRLIAVEAKSNNPGKTSPRGGGSPRSGSAENDECGSTDNPTAAIDKAICEYLDQNPDFPVSIQKVAPNYYVFGDRGTSYVTQRGQHIVVRVGGGFKSLQVFMDERALMVTRDAAAALSQQRNGA